MAAQLPRPFNHFLGHVPDVSVTCVRIWSAASAEHLSKTFQTYRNLLDPKPTTKDQRLKIKDQRSKIKDQRSKIKLPAGLMLRHFHCCSTTSLITTNTLGAGLKACQSQWKEAGIGVVSSRGLTLRSSPWQRHRIQVRRGRARGHVIQVAAIFLWGCLLPWRRGWEAQRAAGASRAAPCAWSRDWATSCGTGSAAVLSSETSAGAN